MGLWGWLKKKWYIALFLISLNGSLLLAVYGIGFLTAEHHLSPYHEIDAITEAVGKKYALRLVQIIFS